MSLTLFFLILFLFLFFCILSHHLTLSTYFFSLLSLISKSNLGVFILLSQHSIYFDTI